MTCTAIIRLDTGRHHSATEVWRLLISMSLFTLMIDVLYFTHFRSYYAPDSPTYIASAAHLIAGHGFTDGKGHPETLVTPGYPLLIASFLAVGTDLKYLVALQ